MTLRTALTQATVGAQQAAPQLATMSTAFSRSNRTADE